MTDELEDLLSGAETSPAPAGSRDGSLSRARPKREGPEAFGSPLVPAVAAVLVIVGAAVASQGWGRLANALAYLLCGVVPAILVALYRRSNELRAARRRVAVSAATVRASVFLIIVAIAVSALNAYLFAAYYL